MKVLGIGNALVDILIKLDDESIIKQLGYPKGSMQLIEASRVPVVADLIKNIPVLMASGGSAANTIHGLARLGTSCGFIGKIGNEDLGDFYKNDLREAGVEAYLNKSETVTGRSYALITPDSERTFATYLGAAIEMQSGDLKEAIFSGYDILHIEGYLVQNPSLIEKALQLAKSNELMVSLDLASFNVVEANIDFLKRIIPEYVDIVFANEEEAKAYTGKKPSEALKEIADQVNIAVVKVGKEGSMVKSKNDSIMIDVSPIKAIDTTGAGDQYAAGFLHGYINNKSFYQCGTIGSLMAGTVIAYYGARIPEKCWPEITEKVREICSS